MDEIAIIIPSRLAANRLANKPLKLIRNKEMILHVYEAAIKAKIGKVYVATPDKKIFDIVSAHGGKAIITQYDHQTGTDRVFEVFDKNLKRMPRTIINLQGDMPNIKPETIKILADHIVKNTCDIATLSSKIKNNDEKKDPNVVKVVTEKKINPGSFSKATDFFRSSMQNFNDKTYHHIGIYAFTNKALIRYVKLKRSKTEIERNLEQLRALENKMKINVGYVETSPLSVDTEQDLVNIKRLME
tara:strand:- start:915 stop:1646 length:732 start_codon:yes stop_codon:yes gene_type:complete